MSYFVYVSHIDPVDALLAARKLMECGDFPFIPQLNKLIPGMKDEEWENYYKKWMFKCDCVYATASFRQNEIFWANENNIPIVRSMNQLTSFKLPPFGELGRKFGEEVASYLSKDEDWRKIPIHDVIKNFHDIVGIARDPVKVAVLAMKYWDRKKRG